MDKERKKERKLHIEICKARRKNQIKEKFDILTCKSKSGKIWKAGKNWEILS